METLEYEESRSFALEDRFTVVSVTIGARTERLLPEGLLCGDAGADILYRFQARED